MARAGWLVGTFSAVKLWKSSSISGPCATSKPTSRNRLSMRSRARVTGCRPPLTSPRPSSVTSMRPAESFCASASVSSSARRASIASCTACLASLMRAPAAGRSVAGSLPSDLSCSVRMPFLPSHATRASSRRARSALAAICASARAVRSASDSMASPLDALALPRSGSLELGLGLFADGDEGCRFVHGQLGEDLAIDLDAGLQQAMDQDAVGQALLAGRGIDARDPQCAEVALLLAAIAVGILPGLDDRLVGRAEYLAAGVVITLGLGQDLLVSASGDDAAFDSCHVSIPR